MQNTKSVTRFGKAITTVVCLGKNNRHNKDARKGMRLIVAKHTMYVSTQNKSKSWETAGKKLKMPDGGKLGMKNVIHCVIMLHQHSNLKAACSYLIKGKKKLFPTNTQFRSIFVS